MGNNNQELPKVGEIWCEAVNPDFTHIKYRIERHCNLLILEELQDYTDGKVIDYRVLELETGSIITWPYCIGSGVFSYTRIA